MISPNMTLKKIQATEQWKTEEKKKYLEEQCSIYISIITKFPQLLRNYLISPKFYDSKMR